VNWGLIPYNEGSWIDSYGKLQTEWENDKPAIGNGPLKQHWQMAMTQTGYQTLLRPDGPIYFAGDHVSHIVGWQEGAAISALHAVRQISGRVNDARIASPSGTVA